MGGDPPRVAPEFSGLESRRILVVGPQTIARNGVADQLAAWGADITVSESWPRPAPSIELVVCTSGAREGAGIAMDDTVPLIRLLRPGEVSPGPEQVAQADLLTPVKPRALFAAARKLLKLARSVKRTAPKPSAFTAEFAQRHPLRILLVEDNPVNARVALLILKRLGYAAEWAVNGRKAVELFADRVFDVVLMDLQMPEMNGLDATRAILLALPPGHHPFIIALTANARKEDREACDAVGMRDFISKPVHLKKLPAGLERAHQWRLARNIDLAPHRA
jgi:CheY-like chemotaxis protein